MTIRPPEPWLDVARAARDLLRVTASGASEDVSDARYNLREALDRLDAVEAFNGVDSGNGPPAGSPLDPSSVQAD